VAAVEFAMVLPFLFILFGGTVEAARALMQTNAVEKGLRAGAAYVARAPLPLSDADKTVIGNLVRTGTTDGTGALLTNGWSDAAATVVVTALAPFDAGGGASVPVFRITASVPFAPLVPWPGGTFTVTRQHEQAYAG
jgi:Flp pilus assembly protein TadG